MNGVRTKRQKAMAELIRTRRIASQEELAAMLAADGYSVTQATVSRDLDELGAIKVRRDGRTAYAMPDDSNAASWAGKRLAGIVAEWVRSIETAGNLVVIRTPPGSAHLVGLALDQAGLPDVVGTISGDDTIFIATRDAKSGEATSAALLAMQGR